MTFAQRLAAAAGLVEERLEALLAQCGPKEAPRLAGAMRHALLAGGKRFRPFLVIESAALLGVPAASALDTAAALECMHCYSLVHDDLPCMDDDDMRRGQPTVHVAYDEWTAVLAGDALATLAFEILARPQAHPDAGVRSELGLGLARAAGGQGMVEGQMLDLEACKRGGQASPTRVDIETLQSLKTGALIAWACETGAVLAEAEAPVRAALRRYGENLGLAFQIADDLLDAEGDARSLGKATGKDGASGKATLVGLLGGAKARERLAEAERNAVAALQPFGQKGDILIEAARFAARRAH